MLIYHLIGVLEKWDPARSRKPFLGIGPSGTRHNCKYLNEKDVNWLPGRNYCGNHPHNFYVQLFAETGILA